VLRRLGEVDQLLAPVGSLFAPRVAGRALFSRAFPGWGARRARAERFAPLPPEIATIRGRFGATLRDLAPWVFRFARYRLGLGA
jgi:hypothetical protein